MKNEFGDSWFPHDIHAIDDTKVRLMLRDLGSSGYGWFWAMVEKLYVNGEDGLTSDDLEVISLSFFCEPDEGVKYAAEFVKRGLLAQKNGCWFSRRVSETLNNYAQNRADFIESRRNAGKASGLARKKSGTAVEQERTAVNTCSTPVQQSETPVQSLPPTSENEHVLNSVEHVFKPVEQNELREEKRRKSTEDRVETSSPSPLQQKGVEDGLMNSTSLFSSETLRSLESQYGLPALQGAVEVVKRRMEKGALKNSPDAYLSAVLQNARKQGQLQKLSQPFLPKKRSDRDSDRPMPNCDICGSALYPDQNNSTDWHCSKCGRHWHKTADGGFEVDDEGDRVSSFVQISSVG